MTRNGRYLLLSLVAFTCIFALAACDGDGAAPANPQFNGTFRGVGAVTQGGATKNVSFTADLSVGSPLSGTFTVDGEELSATLSGEAEGDEATFTFTIGGDCSGSGSGTAMLTGETTLSLDLSGSDCEGTFNLTGGTATPETAGFGNADGIVGGRLYDKFWAAETGFDQNDPNIATFNDNGDFFRCKQCHAWDQLANTASYINRAPRPTRPNVSSITLDDVGSMTDQDLFDAIKTGSNVTRRGVGADLSTYDPDTNPVVGDQMPDYSQILTDAQIWDLVKFLKQERLDTARLYDIMTEGVYPTGSITFSNIGQDGNAANGDTIFANTCAAAGCHGPDGTAFLVDNNEFTIGRFVRSKPNEAWHKVKFGQLGTQMIDLGITSLSDMQDIYKALADTTKYPDEPPVELQSVIRGGLLYDTWWTINGAAEPTETNPTYPVEVNAQVNPPGRTGSQTWRCKECHGWDYQGKDGAYASPSSHVTGIAGIFNAQTMTSEELFDIIRNGTAGSTGTMTGHTSDQLSNDDVQDLVNFIREGLIDLSPFIGADKLAVNPDLADGQTRYDGACAGCHGADGSALVFGGDEVIGDIAQDNPWEFFHKVRFGQPGSSPTMPSSIANGWTNQEVTNVLGYAQTLPLFGQGQ